LRKTDQDVINRKLTIANDDRAAPMDDGNVSPDHVQPFMLESSQLRGRIVRLPDVTDAIITAHGYPQPIAKLLAEALCLTTLLAGMLKFDGVFTLQAKGRAMVKTLVCDMTNDGTLRGYVGYDADALEILGDPDISFQKLTGGGYLAFTVDQSAATDRYQGIVPLDGDSLTDCVLHYFQQSEQITTGFVSFVDQDAKGKWTGAAMMIQQLAKEGGSSERTEPEMDEEHWRRAMMLMQTAKQTEMLDAALPLNTLLYRLFHEEGVRVFDPIAIQKGCRCSLDKIRHVIDHLPEEEKQELAINGKISVTCEFCNTTYDLAVDKSS
jgi:molecular chaperone Hsp33